MSVICHVSYLQNFEHVITLAQQLWAHYCHVSHFLNFEQLSPAQNLAFLERH